MGQGRGERRSKKQESRERGWERGSINKMENLGRRKVKTTWGGEVHEEEKGKVGN